MDRRRRLQKQKEKDQEKIFVLSETLSAACAGCHRKWRDRKAPENRCK